MTKVFINRIRTPASRRGLGAFNRSKFLRRELKSLDRMMAEVSPANIGSARVECILDRNGTVKKIEIYRDEALPNGALDRQAINNGEVRNYTLVGFTRAVKDLGKLPTEGGLSVDFKTAQRLQRVFFASKEDKALLLEKQLYRKIPSNLSQIGTYLRPHLHQLPIENAFNLVSRIIQGYQGDNVDQFSINIRTLVLDLYAQEGLLASNHAFISNEAFMATILNDGRLLVPFFEALSIEGKKQFITAFPRPEIFVSLAPTLRSNIVNLDTLVDIIFNSERSTCEEITNALYSAGVEFRLKSLLHYRLNKVLEAHSEDLTDEQYINLISFFMNTVDDRHSRGSSVVVSKLLNLEAEKLESLLQVTLGLNKEKALNTLFEKLLNYKSNLSCKNLVLLSKYFLPGSVQVTITQMMSYQRKLSYLFNKTPDLLLKTIAESDLDASQRESILKGYLFSGRNNKVLEIENFDKSLTRLDLFNPNIVQLLSICFTSFFMPSADRFEVLLPQLKYSFPREQIQNLPPDLQKCWEAYRTWKIDHPTPVTLCTPIPTPPLGEVTIINPDETWAILQQKGIKRVIVEKIKAIWEKPITGESQAHFRIFTRKHISQAVALNESGKISDEDMRIFFSDIQYEANICWQGLYVKIQDAYHKMALCLVKDKLPDLLQPKHYAYHLTQQAEVNLRGADEAAYGELEDELVSFRIHLEKCTESCLSGATFEEKEEILQSFANELFEKIKSSKSNVTLTEEAKDKLGLYNERHIKFLLALRDHPEGLNPVQLLKEAKLAPHMERMLPNLIKRLIKESLVISEEGRYKINPDHETVQGLDKALASSAKPPPSKDVVVAAVKFAIARSIDSSPQMKQARLEDAKIPLRVSLVSKAKPFFKDWIDAQKAELKLDLVMEKLTLFGKAQVEGLLSEVLLDKRGEAKPASDEEKLNYIQEHMGTLALPGEAGDIYRLIGSGNEVHVMTAIKRVYAEEFGFDLTEGAEDSFALNLQPLIASSPGLKMKMMTYLEDADSPIHKAKLDYLAMALNATAGEPTESIKDYQKIALVIQDQLGEAGQEAEFEKCFTLEEEDAKPRLTPIGMKHLLDALELS